MSFSCCRSMWKFSIVGSFSWLVLVCTPTESKKDYSSWESSFYMSRLCWRWTISLFFRWSVYSIFLQSYLTAEMCFFTLMPRPILKTVWVSLLSCSGWKSCMSIISRCVYSAFISEMLIHSFISFSRLALSIMASCTSGLTLCTDWVLIYNIYWVMSRLWGFSNFCTSIFS